MRVSIQQIKDELIRHVNEHTSYSADFDSVEDAINHYTKELHNEINERTVFVRFLVGIKTNTQSNQITS